MEELEQFKTSNFTNIDEVDVDKEEVVILENNRFGNSKKERAFRLKSAKRIAIIVNWASGFIAIWIIFKPVPYKLAIWSTICFPFLIVACLIYYKGIIKLHDKDEKSAYPTIFNGLAYSCSAICLKCYLEYDILNSNRLILFSFCYTSLIITTAIFLSKKFEFKVKKNLFLISFIGILIYFHAIGSITAINCMEDDSIPEVTEVNVLNKIKSKTTRIPKYKFKLSPWGPFQNNKNVTVRYDLFKIIEPGENVHVCVYKGLFNIPWYIVIE